MPAAGAAAVAAAPPKEKAGGEVLAAAATEVLKLVSVPKPPKPAEGFDAPAVLELVDPFAVAAVAVAKLRVGTGAGAGAGKFGAGAETEERVPNWKLSRGAAAVACPD